MEKEAIQNKEKNFVSCVLYLHNDGKNIREFLKTAGPWNRILKNMRSSV